MLSSELDFDLPQKLIAQQPAEKRSASRLLHYSRSDQRIWHRQFQELPSLLRNGDLLVFNDARVIPAKFMLRKPTGGRVEALFLKELSPGRWHVLLRNAGKTTRLCLADQPEIAASIERPLGGGEYEIQLETIESATALLNRIGRMPLPPYIKRAPHDDWDALDRVRYQTIYARVSGSVAAPTAGLHFTEEILKELDARGIQRTLLTLHVGMGTFKPISTQRLEDHSMHCESYSISPEAAGALNSAKQERRRIVAVGTTSARVLETQPENQLFHAKAEDTRIFIYPPYRWKHVDALITNFHLPRSTLIALVAAMTGLAEQRRIYELAIKQHYRFFSYGDAMFIE